jgi:hypothetical protein
MRRGINTKGKGELYFPSVRKGRSFQGGYYEKANTLASHLRYGMYRARN